MKFEGIIFDFNGVLWWDSHLHEVAWQQYSSVIRGTPFSAEEMAIHVHGRNNQYTLEYLLGYPIQRRDELNRLTNEKEKIYRKLCLAQGNNFKLSPGAAELLNDLKNLNIPRAIATASEKSNLDFFIKHLFLMKWFTCSQIIYDDLCRPGKPAPDIYLDAAASLRLKPEKCVVVEDSYSGIQAADAAGIGFIIALGPIENHDQLKKIRCVNRVVSNLGQIGAELFV